MMQNKISRYVRTLFEESRNGELTIGSAGDRFDYPVDWNEETADALAEACGVLVACIATLAGQYPKLLKETRHLTQAQLDAWNIYLRPFPEHHLDMEALQFIWEKLETGETLTEEERALSQQYIQWFEENAASRLPYKHCAPTQLISRARRYCRLVRLNAPAVVQEAEAKEFAEEFVLYHCMK